MSKHRPAKVERFLSQAPPPSPDLFGIVQRPRIARSKPKPEAEWPAGKNRRAGDRNPERLPTPPPRPPACLLGLYVASEAGESVHLDREDRVRLLIRASTLEQGPTVADRTVSVGYPGGGKPKFASGLYNRSKNPADRLDGHAFQHHKGGRWYRIVRTGPNLYRVEREASRRGRRTR